MLLSLPFLSRVRYWNVWLANLISWLISLVYQFWLVHLNKHQLVEILLTACNFMNCNVSSFKTYYPKIFNMCKTKCCNKTASEIFASQIIRSSFYLISDLWTSFLGNLFLLEIFLLLVLGLFFYSLTKVTS